MKRWPILAVATLLVLAPAACSSESAFTDGTTTTTTTPKQAVCEAAAQLQKSVKALADPSVLSEGTSGITDALDTVQQDLENLASTAQTAFKPQVDDVRRAISDLQSAVEGMSSSNFLGGAQAVGSAIADVASTTQALFRAVQEECPAGSSTTGGTAT